MELFSYSSFLFATSKVIWTWLQKKVVDFHSTDTANPNVLYYQQHNIEMIAFSKLVGLLGKVGAGKMFSSEKGMTHAYSIHGSGNVRCCLHMIRSLFMLGIQLQKSYMCTYMCTDEFNSSFCRHPNCTCYHVCIWQYEKDFRPSPSSLAPIAVPSP